MNGPESHRTRCNCPGVSPLAYLPLTSTAINLGHMYPPKSSRAPPASRRVWPQQVYKAAELLLTLTTHSHLPFDHHHIPQTHHYAVIRTLYLQQLFQHAQ